MSSRARIAVATVLLVGFLFGAVFPTRTYLRERREIAAAAARVELFRNQNGRLDAEVKRLQSDEEIERMARERFNLVKPGEEAYAVVPVPEPAAPPPPPPAPDPVRRKKPSPVLAWVRDTLRRVF